MIIYHTAVGKRRMQSCILQAYLSSRLIIIIMIELVRLPLTVSRRCAIAPEVGKKP